MAGAARLWTRGTAPAGGVCGSIEGLRDHPCLWACGQHAGIRELLCAGGYRALYRVIPDTGRDETAGDVRVLRVFGPGQSRDRL